MKTHRLLLLLVKWEKCVFFKYDNRKKLIAEIASLFSFTYCMQISERSMKNKKISAKFAATNLNCLDLPLMDISNNDKKLS